MERQQAAATPEQRAIITFLRGKAGLKIRIGVFNGRRTEYFKGKSAIKAVLSPAYKKVKNAPPVQDEPAAIALLQSMIPLAFYLRVERGAPLPSSAQSPVSASAAKGKNIRPLQIQQQQMFAPDEYYAWFFEGPQWTLWVGAAGLVAITLAAVMFPLWPASMRIGVWYLSILVLGLVGAFFGIAIIRLVVYVVTWFTNKPGIWIFPNLFEDVGFVDSFIPLWAWDHPPPKKGKKKRKHKEARSEAVPAIAINGEVKQD